MEFGEKTAAVLGVMRAEKNIIRDFVSDEAVAAGYQLARVAEGLQEELQNIILELVKQEIPLNHPYTAVWWYSVLVNIRKDPVVFLELITYIRANRDIFPLSTQYFLFYQLKALRFRFQELNRPEIKKELWHYFKEVVDDYAEEMSAVIEWIPAGKRDDTLAVVITEQFLGIQHGPSKTAMDRCMALATRMGKRVFLINTGEVLSNVGSIAFAGGFVGNYNPGFCRIKEIKWKDVVVPYRQCSGNMPDMKEIKQLLDQIRVMAPGYVVSIGGSGILANMVSRMLPVLTVGLSPSDLEFTTTQFQTLSRKLLPYEKELLAELGYEEDHVIESVFTSELKSQAEKITRSDLGVSDDKFLMVVVGGRLGDEVTDEFLEMLEETVSGNMHIGFLGCFVRYDECMKRHPGLRAYTSCFGFCADILSRLEVCDLYLNPLRQGGGTSCVEAMYMGLPVVTIGYGDVAVNAGEEFWVNDYARMKEKIIQYHDDRTYYRRMSERAKKRAEILLDTESEFAGIMETFHERMKKTDHIRRADEHAGV